MSLASYIEKQKEKSPAEKTRFAFLSALGITIVIFILWAANLTYVMSNESNEVVATSTESSSVLTELGSSIDRIGAGFSEVKNKIQQVVSNKQ